MTNPEPAWASPASAVRPGFNPVPPSPDPRRPPHPVTQCVHQISRAPLTTDKPYSGNDFYCDVAIPRPDLLRVVHEDDRVLAFHHTRPFWTLHVVVVPKRHIASLTEISPKDAPDVRALLNVIQAVARDVEAEHGAAAVLTNLGRYQDSKHLHVHIHAGSRIS